MVGGYVEHILHVVKFSQEVRDIWEKNGATINFTNEELVFTALHHDLGKGWRFRTRLLCSTRVRLDRKNRGERYSHTIQNYNI